MRKFFRKIKCKLGFHELLCSNNRIFSISINLYIKSDYFKCKYCKYHKIGHLNRSDKNEYYKYIRKEKIKKLNAV